jgi:hypothetical protein
MRRQVSYCFQTNIRFDARSPIYSTTRITVAPCWRTMPLLAVPTTWIAQLCCTWPKKPLPVPHPARSPTAAKLDTSSTYSNSCRLSLHRIRPDSGNKRRPRARIPSRARSIKSVPNRHTHRRRHLNRHREAGRNCTQCEVMWRNGRACAPGGSPVAESVIGRGQTVPIG